MKEKFTTDRWEKAVAALFIRSISDPKFRQLCLENPRAAIEQVAPYLELPRDFKFQFAARAADVVYSYQLPPPLDCDTDTKTYAAMLIEQNANGLTHPPTSTGVAHGGGGGTGTGTGTGSGSGTGNPIQ